MGQQLFVLVSFLRLSNHLSVHPLTAYLQFPKIQNTFEKPNNTKDNHFY